MKKTINICIAVVLVAMSSCGKDDSRDQLQQRLISERDSLQVLANTNQQQLDRMTAFFDKVARSIDSITEQESILAAQVDLETNRRYTQRELALRLNQLSEIITGQRQRIASLIDSLNNKVDTVRTEGLRNTIAYLTNQLAQKEEQIERLKAEISGNRRDIRDLKSKVSDLSATVGELSTQNNALTEAVQLQTEIINEGYMLVASKQQLKDMGVIEGGGLLKRSKINLGKVKTSDCSKVDIAKFNELPVNSNKITLLSAAPATSYTIVRSGDRSILKISDANAFWSLSNVLIVQTQ